VHLGVAGAVPVLRRTGRGDEAGLDQRAFAQQQAARGLVGVDGGKEALAEVVRLEQMAEVEQL
jgi:hypothetical protein